MTKPAGTVAINKHACSAVHSFTIACSRTRLGLPAEGSLSAPALDCAHYWRDRSTRNDTLLFNCNSQLLSVSSSSR